MKKIMIYTIIMFLISQVVHAYELPEIDVSKGKKPEIVLFLAESLLVDEKLSYVIRWKTINASDVMMTYFGKVALSGNVTITEDEYKKGAITLTATSDTSKQTATKTINKNLIADGEAPIIFKAQDDDDNVQQFYSPYPYRPYRRPLRGVRRY